MTKKTSPRFILRRTTPEQQRLGGMFELLLADEPERPLKVASFSGDLAHGFEFVAYEYIPSAKLVQQESCFPGSPPRLRFRIAAADVRLEGY